MSVTAVGVAVKYSTKIEWSSIPPASYRTLIVVTLAATFASVAWIDAVTERETSDLDDKWRIGVRLISVVLLPLLGVVGGTMNGGTFLGLVALLCVIQVAFDMSMAPMAGSTEHAMPVSEVHRRRRDGSQIVAPTPSPWTPGITIRMGTPSALRRDVYFWLVEGSWTRLFVSLIVSFIVLNASFASLFLLDPASISSDSPVTFFDAFSFSVQTSATIGYGVLSPGSIYGDALVAIESVLGLLGAALATGLMLAKASRPVAKVMFSNVLVRTTWDGKRMLVFRVANARGNEIVEAAMTLSLLRDEISPEGHHIRKVIDLDLERARTPLFTMSWTVRHVLDEHSPLADVDWEHPEEHFMAIIATMLGHDGTYAQTVHAQHVWTPNQVRSDHRFSDIISQLPDGRMIIDYAAFHDTEPDGTA